MKEQKKVLDIENPMPFLLQNLLSAGTFVRIKKIIFGKKIEEERDI